MHLELNDIGGPQFQNKSGCLPPCRRDEFDMLVRRADNPILMSGVGQNGSALGLTLRSTNTNVETDVILYGLDNMVGDIGGFMGMFLGISLVSIYQVLELFVKKAFRKK